MIFRIASDGSSVEVEGEDGPLFKVATSSPNEADALVRKAIAEGVEAIRPKKKGK